MRKKFSILALTAVFSLAFAFAGGAQQKAADTAVDLVCGMTVKKAEAKATFEHMGTTYYFCSAGCKEAFAKDPAKYLAKAERKSGEPATMGTHQHAGMMTHGQMKGSAAETMECPLHAKDVKMATENLPDGIAVKYTSENPETVKKIQKHLAETKGHCPGCGNCGHQEQVKK